MGNNEFIKRAKTIITEYFNSNVDGTDGILLGRVMCLLYGAARSFKTTKHFSARIFQMACTTKLPITEIKKSFIWMHIKNGKIY